MLSRYIQAAMRHARYEILKDDGGFYGDIPRCRGVCACAPTLEECRSALADALEDWLLFRIHKPNPHQNDIGRDLLARILRPAVHSNLQRRAVAGE